MVSARLNSGVDLAGTQARSPWNDSEHKTVQLLVSLEVTCLFRVEDGS
jgi:hypothetical protein